MSFTTFSELLQRADAQHKPCWEAVMLENCHEQNLTREQCFESMRQMYHAMRKANAEYDAALRSASGMAGGAGQKLQDYHAGKSGLLGGYLQSVVEIAVKMAESNACMKRIVAAPTAGSCGVIPAVLLSYANQKQVEEDELVKALFTAAGIGSVFAESASIAGAEGGCQAEIGVASSMAAGAVTFLEGGDNSAVIHAAVLAIKSMLGLTCDPVAGLVEVPCIKRNAFGASSAVVAAHLALAGIRSAIPPDEVVDSMRRIGELIPACLRETGQAGLAATQTAADIALFLQENGN